MNAGQEGAATGGSEEDGAGGELSEGGKEGEAVGGKTIDVRMIGEVERCGIMREGRWI